MRIELVGILGEEIEYVILDNEDGSQVSMPKSVYDAQQEAAKDAAN